MQMQMPPPLLQLQLFQATMSWAAMPFKVGVAQALFACHAHFSKYILIEIQRDWPHYALGIEQKLKKYK